MKKIKVIFLDVEQAQKPQLMEINDDYKEYLKILRIGTLDIIRRPIGGKDYQIVIDDNGRLKQNPICSAEDSFRRPALYGNIIITGLVNPKGELTGLTIKDIERICNKVTKRFSFVTGKEHYVVRFSKE